MIRTCSTGYKGSIHVNALGGRHTHTHTHTPMSWTKAILKNQLCTGLWLACNWFKKFITLYKQNFILQKK